MKKTLIITTVILVLGLFVAGQVLADVKVGASFDKDGLKSFVLEIGEHYKAPEKEVKLVREAKLSDDELPVAFHIARHAGVSVEKIIQLRLRKMSWMNITLQLGMNAEIFYVAFDKDPGPPYGKAWGHFKKQKRKHWHKIRMNDVDIVNFVNLKFICDRHGHKPADVVKARKQGKGFVGIHAEVKKARKMAKQKKIANANQDKAEKKKKKKNKK